MTRKQRQKVIQIFAILFILGLVISSISSLLTVFL